MEKIRLGKTGMMVSRLGMGGIPIQRVPEADAVAVVQRCLDLGINYIDTANGYTTSEERIGRAVAGRRESVFLASKSMARTRQELEGHIRLSLERLGTGYIDLYQLHQVGDMKTLEKVLAPGGLADVLEDARRAGTVRHIGVTSHQIDVAREAVRSGRFETVMFPFNFVTSEAAGELLPLAREHDVGYIVMKPLAGGMLDNATLAFKYIFQFPDVLPIPGIEKVGEIEEIVGILEGPHALTAAERAEMQRLREELGTRFCRRCDYCQPCAQEIPISMVMWFPAFSRRMPPESLMADRFAKMMERAGSCTECGECEARCPYQLPIRKMIAEHHRLYLEKKRRYRP